MVKTKELGLSLTESLQGALAQESPRFKEFVNLAWAGTRPSLLGPILIHFPNNVDKLLSLQKLFKFARSIFDPTFP